MQKCLVFLGKLEEFTIFTILLHQTFMTSLLNCLSFLHYDNEIVVFKSRKTVSNSNTRFVPGHFFEGLLHNFLGFVIQSTGRLIKAEIISVLEESAGHG